MGLQVVINEIVVVAQADMVVAVLAAAAAVIVLRAAEEEEAIPEAMAEQLIKVRAAVVHDATSARLAREHNDANVVAFGQRLIGVETAREALRVLLKTGWEGGRPARRDEKLSKGCQK